MLLWPTVERRIMMAGPAITNCSMRIRGLFLVTVLILAPVGVAVSDDAEPQAPLADRMARLEARLDALEQTFGEIKVLAGQVRQDDRPESELRSRQRPPADAVDRPLAIGLGGIAVLLLVLLVRRLVRNRRHRHP